jgi:molybdenum cofactor cytidylyltransferase
LSIAGILLAAGSGSRFGGGKLLHPLPDGTPIGLASLRSLKQALPRVLAVVRDGDSRLRDLLAAEGVPVIACADAHLGLSRSLVCGVRASMDASGWVFALGDMPFVAPGTTRAVATRLAATGAIVVPRYQGRRGNPVGLGAAYREALLEVQADEGARSILRRHERDVTAVDCEDPGILRDIDRREDLSSA